MKKASKTPYLYEIGLQPKWNVRMLLSNLNLLAQAPNGVARLRELILTLAVQGKLVPQDPSDEPAGALLKRVASRSTVRTAKRLKESGGSDEVPAPYGLPEGWA